MPAEVSGGEAPLGAKERGLSPSGGSATPSGLYPA